MENNKKYLIGIGTNKAGTTSLFNYLGDHPQITPSVSKQLNYFLSGDTTGIESEGKWNRPYIEAFKNSDGSEYFLDISPDYMYDSKVANNIAIELNPAQVYILCILRDPSDRFNSWFNYSKQNGHLNQQISFEDFFKNQKKNESSISPFSALETGHYINYLQTFIHKFPNFKIIFTEDLKNNPKKTLASVTTWLNLNDSIYRDYSFNTYNKTVKVKNRFLENLYLGIHGWVKRGFINLPFFFNLLKPFGKFISSIVRKSNSEKVESNPSDNKELINVYTQSVKQLEKKLNITTPWKRYV